MVSRPQSVSPSAVPSDVPLAQGHVDSLYNVTFELREQSQGDKRKRINDMHLCLIVKQRSIMVVEGWDYVQMFMFAASADIPAADFRL